MEYSTPQSPNKFSPYNHVTAFTPLGIILIEWKGWKETPDYSITFNQEYIGTEYSLDDAKKFAFKHISDLHNKLNKFMEGVNE